MRVARLRPGLWDLPFERTQARVPPSPGPRDPGTELGLISQSGGCSWGFSGGWRLVSGDLGRALASVPAVGGGGRAAAWHATGAQDNREEDDFQRTVACPRPHSSKVAHEACCPLAGLRRTHLTGSPAPRAGHSPGPRGESACPLLGSWVALLPKSLYLNFCLYLCACDCIIVKLFGSF